MKQDQSQVREAAVLAILLVSVLVGLTLSTLQVASFDFLYWDDNRVLASLGDRAADPASRTAWLMNTITTNLWTPLSLGVWGQLADAFGPTPRAFHLAVFVLHGGNIVLVALLCRSLIGMSGAPSGVASPLAAWTASLCAAGLWGLHPLRAEVVGWVAAMPYALSTTLGLMAAISFVRAASSTGSGRNALLAGSAGLFLLATLAHPQVAPLCMVFFLIDRYLPPQRAPTGAPAVRHARFLPWHGVMFAIAVAVTATAIAVRSRTNSETMLFSFPSEGFSPLQLLEQAARYLGFATDFGLYHAWLPLKTALVYEPYDNGSWLAPTFLLGLTAFLALLFWAFRRFKANRPGLLVAIGCHLAFALPASGLFVVEFIPSDRYAYGLTIVATVVISVLFYRWLRQCDSALRWGIFLTLFLTTFALSSYGLAASLRDWRHTVPLMEHLIATAPQLDWKLFAKLRIVDYWRASGDPWQGSRSLLQLPAILPGPDAARVIMAVRYTAARRRCEDATFLLNAGAGGIGLEQQAALRNVVDVCYRSRH